MRQELILFISQKIKSLGRWIAGLFAKFGFASLSSEVKGNEKEAKALKDETPNKVPIDDYAAKYVLKYIFSIVNNTGCDRGVGIIVDDVNNLRERNSFIDIVCLSFRYVTIYTENLDTANRLGDIVYEKYGLPIMILSISEAARCRYPVIIDFVHGKVRCGRDLCIDGAITDNGGRLTGLCVGSRIVPVSDKSDRLNKTIDNS